MPGFQTYPEMAMEEKRSVASLGKMQFSVVSLSPGHPEPKMTVLCVFLLAGQLLHAQTPRWPHCSTQQQAGGHLSTWLRMTSSRSQDTGQNGPYLLASDTGLCILREANRSEPEGSAAACLPLMPNTCRVVSSSLKALAFFLAWALAF